MTDAGLEVAAVEFTGLKHLNLAWCYRLTERTLRVIARNCNNLQVPTQPRLISIDQPPRPVISTDLSARHCVVAQELNVAECSGLRPAATEEFQSQLPHCKVVTTVGSAPATAGIQWTDEDRRAGPLRT